MYWCATFLDDFLCDFKFVMCIIEVALQLHATFSLSYMQRDEH
jgi:hypothetical protein